MLDHQAIIKKISPNLNGLGSISTDTRTLKAGDTYLALVGANFNGHDFIDQALAQGASWVISQEHSNHEQVLQVKDTLTTYQQLAQAYKRSLNPITIGITGSSGKTTTKELLKLILSKKYKVHASQANYNNEIGVPKTILSMPQDTEVLILEMGMRGLGEIELLSQTGEPNIAIITNIGHAHIERLGSLANIRRAKLEITLGLKDHDKVSSTLIIDTKLYSELNNGSIDNIAQILGVPTLHIKHIEKFNHEQKFSVDCFSSVGLTLDINAAAKAAQLLGLSAEDIQEQLKLYQPEIGRGNIYYLANNNIIIDESYNANPESVINATEALIKNYPNLHRIAVIGDIYESHDELIDLTFKQIKNQESDNFTLLDVRGLNIEAITKQVEPYLHQSNTAILFKASRKAALDQVISALIKVSHN